MTLTMLDAGGYLGWLSAALLFAAATAWLKLFLASGRRTLNGRDTLITQPVEKASRLLIGAVALCAIAAALAIAGRMFG